LVAQGKAAEAVAHAVEGNGILVELGGTDDNEAVIQLAWVEALNAAGDPRTRAAAAQARDALLARAARISDPALRHTFLTGLPEHAGPVARAGQRGEPSNGD